MNGDSTPPSRSIPETPVTDVFDLLAESRRRHTLTVIARTECPLEEAALASRVRELESSDACRDLHLELRHCHLPKLADYGVLEYDHERGVVDRGPAFDETLSHVRRIEFLTGQPDGD